MKRCWKMKRSQRDCLDSIGRKSDMVRRRGDVDRRRCDTGRGKEGDDVSWTDVMS
jgi:hypothetical protein